MSQQINLFNPIFRQQEKYFSAVTMAQAIGLVMLGALLLVGYAHYRSARLDAEVVASATLLGATQVQLVKAVEAFPPRGKSQDIEAQIRKAEAETASLEKTAGILRTGELGNTKGYADYLRAFSRQIVDGIWLTGLNIQGAGNEIGLQGRTVRAELVPAYINRLKHEPVMQGKSFSTLEMRVPQPSAVRNADAAAAAQPAAGYIEFSLQSSGLSDQQDAAGVARQ